MIELKDQLELESLMVTEGIDRYRKQLTEAVQGKNEVQVKPQHFFMVSAITPLSNAIKTAVDEAYNGKVGKRSSSLKLLRDADPEVVAYITAKVIINGISSKTSMTTLAVAIGTQIEDHLVFNKFREQNKEFFERAMKKVSQATTLRHQRAAMSKYSKLAGISRDKVTSDTKIALGILLIKLFESETGLIMTIARGKSSPPLIVASQKALDRLNELHTRCELMTPVYMPMILKPSPWTTPSDGGYVTQRLPMVKTRNKAYLEELRHVDMPKVYRAINALQDTSWNINQDVLNVLIEMWEAGSTLAGLPDRENLEINSLPGGLPTDATKEQVQYFKEHNKEQWDEFIAVRRGIYEENIRKQSKRVAVLKIITTAEKMSKYDEFWFPYQMDWRGRMYPVVGTLNPQGQDAAKGLLQFSEGKPLGKIGATWLKIHLANCYGVDKVSYADRIMWTEANAEAILACAKDPLTQLFWTDADKGGKAWQFLAACMAYQGYVEQGEGFVCSLPIGLDGSCNGLQHLSSLVLDPYGAENTNLVDAEKPYDIYQTVADTVSAQVYEDYKQGNPSAVLWQGKVTRSVVKRNVMTVSYGATKYGMLEQLKEDLHKATDGKVKEFLGLDADESAFPHLRYLSELINTAIGDTVRAAPTVMTWLQEIAHLVAKNQLPVRWTTPAGFPVLQSYYKMKSRRLNTTFGNFRIQVRLNQEQKQQDSRKSSLGVSPNYIHSLDASHLMETVDRLLDAGVTGFAMVHDSYGTHPCDVMTMARVLRETFVDMYKDDRLALFKEEIKEQLPPELWEELPKNLDRGEFDLELVKSAGYFFA